MSNNEILHYILQYAADERKLAINRNQQIVFRRSYAVWTCKHLYSLIKRNPNVPAMETIEKFAEQMHKYSLVQTDNKSANRIFVIADEITQDILDGLDIYRRL